jgi:hypothetical protein
MTAAKEAVIAENRTDIERWVADLKADPVTFLRSGSSNFTPRDLWRTEELAAIYKIHHGVQQPNLTALRRALRKAGFFETERVYTRFGRLTLWVVENVEQWRDASPSELGKAYEALLADGSKYLARY